MTDYIKFIDSPAIREHLRTLPPLPPAQQSILIAQSEIRSLDEKLAALREMRATIPPEEFSRGCWGFQSDDSFPVILDRYIQMHDVRAKGGLDAGLRRDWGGDLPNGYAYVPHPFKRGDIIRQGDSYYVLDESVEEVDGRFSWGADDSDMVLYGMSWDKASGSFGYIRFEEAPATTVATTKAAATTAAKAAATAAAKTPDMAVVIAAVAVTAASAAIVIKRKH